MPENAPARAPAGASNRAKGAYQDRDKPAQIRFSNIAAGKGAAAAGGVGLGPAWAAVGAGAMDPPVLGPARAVLQGYEQEFRGFKGRELPGVGRRV